MSKNDRSINNKSLFDDSLDNLIDGVIKDKKIDNKQKGNIINNQVQISHTNEESTNIKHGGGSLNQNTIVNKSQSNIYSKTESIPNLLKNQTSKINSNLNNMIKNTNNNN